MELILLVGSDVLHLLLHMDVLEVTQNVQTMMTMMKPLRNCYVITNPPFEEISTIMFTVLLVFILTQLHPFQMESHVHTEDNANIVITVTGLKFQLVSYFDFKHRQCNKCNHECLQRINYWGLSAQRQTFIKWN